MESKPAVDQGLQDQMEIQQQVRQKAMEMQNEFKSMKNFEKEMKVKEEEMLKSAVMEVTASKNVS